MTLVIQHGRSEKRRQHGFQQHLVLNRTNTPGKPFSLSHSNFTPTQFLCCQGNYTQYKAPSLKHHGYNYLSCDVPLSASNITRRPAWVRSNVANLIIHHLHHSASPLCNTRSLISSCQRLTIYATTTQFHQEQQIIPAFRIFQVRLFISKLKPVFIQLMIARFLLGEFLSSRFSFIIDLRSKPILTFQNVINTSTSSFLAAILKIRISLYFICIFMVNRDFQCCKGHTQLSNSK